MKILSLGFFALLLLLLEEFAVSQDADNDSNAAVHLTRDGCRCEGVTCEPVSEDNCPHGLVDDTRDPCRCCRRCGNGEYEFCDSENLTGKESAAEAKYDFGLCGRGLTCRANRGVPPGAEPEMICYCKAEAMVCGTDGVTYETECLMQKIAFERGQNIESKKEGMCEGAPVVVTPPVDVTNSSSGHVSLQCEVIGNPVPRVEWRRVGADDFLPSGGSGNSRVTVQTRGGPEAYEVTGWLQVMRLEVEDGGGYECVGINQFGRDSGTASIVVEKIDQTNETA